MKKILTIVVSFVFALTFAGCGTMNGGNSVDSSGIIENLETESLPNDTSDSVFNEDSGNLDSEASTVTPPESSGENELPLVPID